MNKSFSKNVLTLMTGTGIAQAIPIAIIPILTRMFSPEDFGLLALYAACVSILGVVATGRYEIAIMLPKDDEDARLLLQLSMLVALFFSFLISIPISIWNAQIARFLGNEDIAVWLYLVPVSVLFTGIYQALTYWNNRQKKFINTAVSRVNQSLFQGFSQTSLGFLQVSGGLICGQFVGIVSGLIYLLKKDRNYKSLIRKSKINSIQKQGIKYHKFPTYGVWGALCDAGAVQMPVILLTKFYSNSVTGMFSLTFRVLNMPTSIISSAIAQVLFQKVVEISQTEPEKLNLYIIKMFLLLFIIYLPAVPVLFIWGESLFSIIFGNEWSQAGVYAGYLVIAVAVRFAVSPLSAVLGLEQNIKMGVLWQVLYLCTISVTLYFSSSLSIEEFLIAFVVHEVVLYLIYLFLILKGTKKIAKC
ncbi:lipopolysaccharide biosynthesis protein [Vibrio cholerae]|uniref:lipopolysaccharide biosynthesis protein n=1 Tax=Vibrio cholerae TaxID=666 RepID=UPI00155F11B0|nr:oligosaccharide flippase family protein [Vibrio cholerae]EGQ8224083.1 oligosaccharide flippase family protein [Vibrio cholerae]EJL6539011.1 oligosaccharide flippase family protein [Vibrio cholerae]NOE58563.1 oligosaccharide flippase family protein [Vibrio cholerae]